MYHILFIHASVDRLWVVSICYLLRMTHGYMSRNIPLWVPLLTFWTICREVELLDHVVILCSMFWGNAVLFSTTAAPFFIPTSNAQHSSFSTSFPMLVILLVYFLIAVVMGLKWSKVAFLQLCFGCPNTMPKVWFRRALSSPINQCLVLLTVPWFYDQTYQISPERNVRTERPRPFRELDQ